MILNLIENERRLIFMKKKLEGIKITGIIYNAVIVASVVVALTAGYKFGW